MKARRPFYVASLICDMRAKTDGYGVVTNRGRIVQECRSWRSAESQAARMNADREAQRSTRRQPTI